MNLFHKYKAVGLWVICSFVLLPQAYPQPGQTAPDHVEPPFWWTGFSRSELQLLIHGKNIAALEPSVDYPGFKLLKVHRTDNPNYLFLDLNIAPETKPGIATLTFKSGKRILATYPYEIRARRKGSAERKGFGTGDAIYLLMPDRFANGDTANDSRPDLAEPADRSNKDGRHGGDLKGIADKLGYLDDLGVTALWLNPVVENNQPIYSYHGYASTDYYRVDPRLGNNEDLVKLSDELHKRGMKLILDMVFNHCGSGHWWMSDLPSRDWINPWPEFMRTNYRAGTITDPYVSEADSNLFLRGWFDRSMPDLNQSNPFVRNYLIQNSIWWTEYTDADGIRQDTHPYPFKGMMAEWGLRLKEEYPEFNVVGECWLNHPASVAYWQTGSRNLDGYDSHLKSVLDFPMYDALAKAFIEQDGWSTGIARLYEVLSQDFSYPNPDNLVVFADNHDVNRFLDSQGDDIRKLKMAVAFILTTRGIPQIYYGTEILLTTGPDKKGDGNKRRDFPGGWPGDTLNAFQATGRTPAQADMHTYTRNLLQWRKNNRAVREGHYRHFVPSEGIYVYFRYHDTDTVMVLMNNNEETKRVPTARYRELLSGHARAAEVISGRTIDSLDEITVEGKSVVVLELK